jgi:uncharacterized protein
VAQVDRRRADDVRGDRVKAERFVARSRIAAPAEVVFRWHEAPGALEALTPAGQPVRLVERTGGLEVGARVVLAIGWGPFRIHWIAEHDLYVAGREFRDVQRSGPFARWVHTHRFLAVDECSSILEDEVEWALPFGAIGTLGRALARHEIARLFAHRHLVTAQAVSGRPPLPA